MGDVVQFAAVVAVVTMAGLSWRWSTVWLQRLRLTHSEEIERLEERIDRLEARLGAANTEDPTAIGPSDEA